MKAKKLRDFVETVVSDMKGQNLVMLDIQKMSSVADYMVVVTGSFLIRFAYASATALSSLILCFSSL